MLTTGLDQGIEKSLGPGILASQVFRVPLHAEGKRMLGNLDGLDHRVWSRRGDRDTRSQIFDGLGISRNVSYWWLSPIGCVTTILFGMLGSLLAPTPPRAKTEGLTVRA